MYILVLNAICWLVMLTKAYGYRVPLMLFRLTAMSLCNSVFLSLKYANGVTLEVASLLYVSAVLIMAIWWSFGKE